jgi:hypothetical protein
MATNDKSTTKSTPKNTTNAPTSTEAPAPAEATTVAEAPATEIVSAAEAKIDLASMDAADILRLSPDVIGAQLGSIPAAVVTEIARTAGPSRMPAIFPRVPCIGLHTGHTSLIAVRQLTCSIPGTPRYTAKLPCTNARVTSVTAIVRARFSDQTAFNSLRRSINGLPSSIHLLIFSPNHSAVVRFKSSTVE